MGCGIELFMSSKGAQTDGIGAPELTGTTTISILFGGSGAAYPEAVGILEYLLAGLGPEARKELAKEAAESVVKKAADTVYDKVDGIREDFEKAAEARRRTIEREAAEKKKIADEAKAAQDLEDELAALKRRVEREG